MAYNKAKIVEAAQKALNQGRISQAIIEYQQVLRHEPKDQVTLMTIGDLFVRQGDTFQALEYFERLANVYLNDGFITKAIAIYKKIAKLAPEEMRPQERLAELYVQQGVLSEARPIYLQLAEAHLKGGRHQQALGLLKKLLEAEPENLRIQVRLAELYLVIGKPKEAVEALLEVGQRMLENRSAGEAEKLARRALEVDPNHAGALTLRARCMAQGSRPKEALGLLESLRDLDSGNEATSYAIELYLQQGLTDRAVELARRAFGHNSKNYAAAYEVATTLLESGEAAPVVELLGMIREAMIEGGEQERLAQALQSAAERFPGRVEPLEWLADVYRRASDSFRLPDVLSRLGEAFASQGEWGRARQTYAELLERDPGNEPALRSLNQVRARMGLGSVPQAAPEAVSVPAAPVQPQVSEGSVDEETQRFVSQSLTDVDLFSSYGLTQKAITLLETVLERAPNHPVVLERLLDLNLGEGNDRRTAELAAQLERVHLDRGDAASAERFAELCRRYERAAGVSVKQAGEAAATEATAEEFEVPVVEAAAVEVEPVVAVPVEANAAAEAAVHEVDLSEEWATLSQQLASAVGVAPQERQAAPTPAVKESKAAEEEVPSPISSEDTEALRAALDAAAKRLKDEPIEVPTAEYELELEPAAPAADAGVALTGTDAPAQPAAAKAMSADEFLSGIASEFGGAGPPVVPPRAPTRSGVERASGGVTAVPPAPPRDTGPLQEVFNEFRAELGEMGTEDEDLETHYNLGIAYREMGLTEESIGEFQKVAKAVQNGRAFRYTMQCYTLLGLSFLEKGQPFIAVMWYEKALGQPGLDSETILALRYDLGMAQELCGDLAAALKSFSLVYGMNIDYRDVSERIATLQKQR